MTEHGGWRVEVWPVAADSEGIWLLGSDSWLSDRVPADCDPHGEVDRLAYEHTPDLPIMMRHSTSWRFTEPHIIVTYMAVFDLGQHVQDFCPMAMPITAELLSAVNRPPWHGADDRPRPRMIDVLIHGIRHLAFLSQYDAETSTALGPQWARHLDDFAPVLAGLYTDRLTA